MKQQTRFYVSRKNPLTWIAAALSLASIVLQIPRALPRRGSRDQHQNIWFQKVLPMAVSLGFALQLVLEGETRFYRTSKPIFWACVYFGQAALDLHLHGGYAPVRLYALCRDVLDPVPAALPDLSLDHHRQDPGVLSAAVHAAGAAGNSSMIWRWLTARSPCGTALSRSPTSPWG